MVRSVARRTVLRGLTQGAVVSLDAGRRESLLAHEAVGAANVKLRGNDEEGSALYGMGRSECLSGLTPATTRSPAFILVTAGPTREWPSAVCIMVECGT